MVDGGWKNMHESRATTTTAMILAHPFLLQARMNESGYVGGVSILLSAPKLSFSRFLILYSTVNTSPTFYIFPLVRFSFGLFSFPFFPRNL